MATETLLRADEWVRVIQNAGSVQINVTLQPKVTATYIWQRAAIAPPSENTDGFRWAGSSGMFAVDLQPGASLWMRLDASASVPSAIITWEA